MLKWLSKMKVAATQARRLHLRLLRSLIFQRLELLRNQKEVILTSLADSVWTYSYTLHNMVHPSLATLNCKLTYWRISSCWLDQVWLHLYLMYVHLMELAFYVFPFVLWFIFLYKFFYVEVHLWLCDRYICSHWGGFMMVFVMLAMMVCYSW